jgi:hypothetical protein
MPLPYLLVVVILCNVLVSRLLATAAPSSQEERKLMEVHIRRNVSDFATVDCDFICQHARGWDLDRVSPVVVVVAEGIGEVENRIF